MSIDFPKEEERILARWKEIDAFLTQVELVSIDYKRAWCGVLEVLVQIGKGA